MRRATAASSRLPLLALGFALIVSLPTQARAQCDPLTQNCPTPGEACYIDRVAQEAVCAEIGAGDTPVGVGEPCTAFNECAKGHTCIDGTCRELCDQRMPNTGCECGSNCFEALTDVAGVCIDVDPVCDAGPTADAGRDPDPEDCSCKHGGDRNSTLLLALLCFLAVRPRTGR